MFKKVLLLVLFASGLSVSVGLAKRAPDCEHGEYNSGIQKCEWEEVLQEPPIKGFSECTFSLFSYPEHRGFECSAAPLKKR